MSLFWKTTFYLWLMTISVLSLIPSPPVPHDGLLGWDKFQHAAAYALLTFLGAKAFAFYRKSSGNRFIPAACLAVTVGGLMEVAQGLFTVTRSAEFTDLLADAVGAVTIVVLARFRR